MCANSGLETRLHKNTVIECKRRLDSAYHQTCSKTERCKRDRLKKYHAPCAPKSMRPAPRPDVQRCARRRRRRPPHWPSAALMAR